MSSANFDPARFTARTGMNLRFDNPYVAINFPGALYGFHYAIGKPPSAILTPYSAKISFA
jgi:hypothetical protein